MHALAAHHRSARHADARSASSESERFTKGNTLKGCRRHFADGNPGPAFEMRSATHRRVIAPNRQIAFGRPGDVVTASSRILAITPRFNSRRDNRRMTGSLYF